METDFYHNGFRDYAPSFGRYLESDPIGILSGTNLYSYASANALSGVDPLGLADTFPGKGVPCPQNTSLVCTAYAPPITPDPADPYHVGINAGGLGEWPADPSDPTSDVVKWMRYDCNYGNGGACSFVAPSNGDTGYGIQSMPINYGGTTGLIPQCASPFPFNPQDPSGFSPAFLKAKQNGYQCVPKPGGGCEANPQAPN